MQCNAELSSFLFLEFIANRSVTEFLRLGFFSHCANERGGELSSGIPPGAAAYHHYVYAAHMLTSVLR
ncbi:hypothetical protein T05_6838 [Trichinella murrelli]|uniref:Uncharacterized protein n=1 Tax=Trichinella murrelli TaxID=144512 RepID=A0A0V0T0F5_9BILA|nr:hypothetical protein T05_6838 [Trichinella murrelli]